MLRVISVLLLFASGVRASDATKPHPHRGVMPKYERVHPSKLGISTSGHKDEDLRTGKPVLKILPVAKGFTRTVSMQDIRAPEAVIWSAIMDLPNYPKYIEGVTACEVYAKSSGKFKGLETVCSKYTLSVAAYKMSYFILHEFEPAKHSMTFHLDYDRCSDLQDTVGYWYVEELDDGWCRVYYSTDSVVPGWIPGFAKTAMRNLAAKRSTSWVEARCAELTGTGVGSAKRAGGPLTITRRRMALLALLGWSLHASGRLASFSLPQLPCLLPKQDPAVA